MFQVHPAYRDGSILAEKFAISIINHMDDFSRAVSQLLLADLKKFVEKSTFIKAEKIFITKNKNETKMDIVKIMDVDDILDVV